MKSIVLVAGLWFSLSASVNADDTAIRFGVLPSIIASRMDTEYFDLAGVLENYFQQSVVIRSRNSYEAYRQALLEESFDIAIAQPFDFVLLRQQEVPYLPVVRPSYPLIAQIVVVDKTVTTAKDLIDKTIAFPPASAAVSILARHSLNAFGVSEDLYSQKYYREHDSCLQAMLTRAVQACVTVPEVRFTNDAYRQPDIRVVHTSPSIPNVVLIIHSRLASHRQELTEHLISVTQGKSALLESPAEDFVFVAASDSDYDIVAEMYNPIIAAQ